MSQIYDALVRAAKHSDLRTAAPQSSVEPKSARSNLSSRDSGREWKIIGTVATVVLVFGLFLIVIANHLLGRALRSEMDQRALTIATNLSAAATGPVMGDNILELYALLTRYAQLEGVAYAFIEDASGKIVGHSIRPFPPELTGTLTRDEQKQAGTRVVTLQGKTVFETRAPILEGQLGTTHLGIWAESVKTEIDAARLPFVGLTAFVLLVAVALSIFLARVMIAPMGGRVNAATEGAGELKTPVENRVRT